MYPNTGAIIRSDINTFVEEAAGADNFFIGESILPPYGVEARSGTYPKLTKTEGALLKPGSTIRAPKASYGEIDRAWTVATYDLVDRGLEELIDDVDQKTMAKYFDMEVITAKLVLRAMRLDHEIRVAAVINNTGNFAATAAAVAYTEANIATINFPLDLADAIERVNQLGEVANTVIMSQQVFNRLRRSTLMQNFIRGNRPSDTMLNISKGTLQQAFSESGIANIYIGQALYDSAKKGQAFVSAKVWGNTYVWVGAVSGGDFYAGGAGRTLVWNPEGGLYVTETYRNEQRRSNVIRVRQFAGEHVVNGAAGTLITTSYA